MGEKEINVFFLSVILTVLLLVMAVYFVIISIRRRNILYKKEREADTVLHKQELMETRQEVQQKLMQHMGSELHDTVGQKLTLTYLQMENTLQLNNIDEIKDKISTQNDLIQESLNELRSISKILVTQDFGNFNFVHFLKKELARIEESGLCKTRFTYPDEALDFLTEHINLSMVRICQEFIQNSLKHSGCNLIEIQVLLTNELLQLTCLDNGRGFDWQKAGAYRVGSGSGLKSIERRINSMGALYKWESLNGTKLQIELPLNKIQHHEA